MTLHHAPTQGLTRAERLRAATHPTHEGLDKSIMAAEPFASLGNYGRFIAVQHGFHRDVAPLYARSDLAALIPDLASLGRFDAVTQDAADLAVALPDHGTAPAGEGLGLPEALGWLYVVEGSNLGAAFLFKAAQRMGLSENHGARHLAGAPEGRAAHWRAFTGALNAAALDEAEEARAIAGAEAAFARVQGLVARHLA